jgi:hypothetical protein
VSNRSIFGFLKSFFMAIVFLTGSGQPNRSQQAGGQQLAFGIVWVTLYGPGKPLGFWFGSITDQPVEPQVGDLDLKVVVSCLQGVRDIDSPWSTPYNTEILTIEPDAGQFMHLSQIKINPLIGNLRPDS